MTFYFEDNDFQERQFLRLIAQKIQVQFMCSCAIQATTVDLRIIIFGIKYLSQAN